MERGGRTSVSGLNLEASSDPRTRQRCENNQVNYEEMKMPSQSQKHRTCVYGSSKQGWQNPNSKKLTPANARPGRETYARETPRRFCIEGGPHECTKHGSRLVAG